MAAAALAVVGLIGAYSYWESYYQHRGFATVALPAPRPARAAADRPLLLAALHREADYIVYMPPGYDTTPPARTRYPVYYLLHGSPGRPVVFIDIANCRCGWTTSSASTGCGR